MSGASGSRRGYHRLLSRQSSSAEKIEKEPSTNTSKSTAKRAAHTSKEVRAHPLLKMLDAKDLEKAAAKPEFLRYLEYMKEGGSLDPALDRPVLHFK